MRAGYIDRSNCCSENINDEIRYLIGPILSKIKYQEKRFTLQSFVEEGKRIISALETHEVSKLLKCSVTNRLFCLDTKRSENDRLTNRNKSATIERRSCSTLLKSYIRPNDVPEQGEPREPSEDRFKMLQTRSASEDWRTKEFQEPLDKTRTRGIAVAVPGPVVAREKSTINRDPYLLRASGGRSLILTSDHKKEIVNPPHNDNVTDWQP